MQRGLVALPGQLTEAFHTLPKMWKRLHRCLRKNFDRPDFPVNLQKSKTNLVKSSPMFRYGLCERLGRFAKRAAFGKTQTIQEQKEF